MRSFATDLRRRHIEEKERSWLRADIPQIAELMEQLSAEYDSDSQHDVSESRRIKWLHKTFNDAWHYVHVIRVAEKIEAIACLARSHLPELNGLVHSVYVTPEFRDYGFGRRVTMGVIDYARSVHMHSLEMPVSKNPIARKLYESLGFEYCDYEGVLLMVKIL